MIADPIASYLAAGGIITRCPTAAVGASEQITMAAEDGARVHQHEAEREHVRVAPLRAMSERAREARLSQRRMARSRPGG